MTPDKATALREAAERATPGPWLAAAKPSSVVGWPVVATGNGRSICSVTYSQPLGPGEVAPGEHWFDRKFNTESAANAAYIALADPPTILALLAERERLRGALERLAGYERNGVSKFDFIAEIDVMRSIARQALEASHDQT